MQATKSLSTFRITGITEGISFLVLLFIAMPLKYFAGFPLAVTIIGGLHGLLFIVVGVLAWEVKDEPVVAGWKKNLNWLLTCLVAAILPFGTFVLDSQLKKRQTK